ncbi:MAG TPA: PIG-L family deacetylase [Lentisphaerae bacterium]|nr:PIG-L family deacetylase [Lentisphaerota bacterium]
MKLCYQTADLFVPDGRDLVTALSRTTHLGIGAHQDDLELMAFHGILECFQSPDLWFTGVTVTDGSGSPRTGLYADHTDEEMRRVRRLEQRKAAVIGGYSAMLQLDFPSTRVKDPADSSLEQDLYTILRECRPRVVYTHNPADKHPTHVAVVAAAVKALRRLPPALRPARVYGCEVWRDLDWLPDSAKVILDVSGRDNLAAALNGVFDSQISGGKRYDLATIGRRRANATYLESHGVDLMDQVIFAMDLTPAIADPSVNVLDLTLKHVHDFAAEICSAWQVYLNGEVRDTADRSDG